MNYNDFMQGIMAIKGMLGAIQISADEQHIRLMGQIHTILNNMSDECNNCLHQEALKKETTAK